MLACSISDFPPSHYEYVVSKSTNFSFQNLDDLKALEGSSPEITRIYLIRTGESLFNRKDENGVTAITSGKSPEVPLTDRGLSQAAELASKLDSKTGTLDIVVYPAASKRAEQTAGELVGKNGKLALRESLEGFLELGMGPWEGLPKDAAYQRELQKWKDLASSEEKYSKPRVAGGESFQETSARALADLEKVVQSEKGKTIFIISHYHTINALALHWMRPFTGDGSSSLPLLPLSDCDLLMVEIPAEESVEQGHLAMLINSGV